MRRSGIWLSILCLLLSSFSFAIIPKDQASAAVAAGSIKIATYNIRATDLTPWDSTRAKAILGYLKSVDIVGIQESRPDSRDWLTPKMKTSGYLRTKPDGARLVFWKSSKFTLVEEGRTILDKDSEGNDKDIVWVKLKETASGAEFYFITSHPTAYHNKDRVLQAKKLKGYLSSHMTDAPIILAGDMNCETGEEPDEIIRSIGFEDAYAIATEKVNTTWKTTLDNFTGRLSGKIDKTSKHQIDHIYVKGGVSVSRVQVMDQRGSDHLPVEADVSISGGGSHPLVLGSYNVHGTVIGNESGCKAKARFEAAAKNILSMNIDIVGMQEYSDYDSSKSPDCNGKKVKLLDILNSNGGNWKSTSKPQGSDGGGYQETQASILYNANVTSLLSDESQHIDGGSIDEDFWRSTTGCNGGSPIFHIASFSDSSGKAFYVANGHWCTEDDSQRKKDTEAIVKIMSDYNGTKFIIGDTNSEVGQNVESIMKDNSYGDAHSTATEALGASYGTMYNNGKGKNIIDRIYYDNETISAPSNYTTLLCKTTSSCGSDHRPIAATFPSVTVGSDSEGGCAGWENQKEIFELGIGWYDVATCTCTDSSGADGMSGDNTFKKLATYMSSKGLSAFAIAGILGNWKQESGYGPFVNQGGSSNWPNNAYGVAQWDQGRRTALIEALKKDSVTEKHFGTYYAQKYSDYVSSSDEDAAGSGLPSGVSITDDAVSGWAKVEVDFMFEEMQDPWYKVGNAVSGKKLKQLAPYLKDSDTIVEALKKATSASHASAIFSLIFERQGNENEAFTNRPKNAEAVLEKVEAVISGNSSGSSTSSEDCGDSSQPSDGSVKSLQSLAKEYTQDWDTSKTLSQTESYKSAVKKSKYVGCPSSPGNDCGAFVYILIHESGWDPNYGGGSGQTAHMDTWFSNSENGWSAVDGLVKVSGSNIKASSLQPGDVLLRSGHIYIFVGDMMGDGTQYFASASMCKRSPAYHTFTDPGTYTVYRKNGGTN